MWLLKNPMSYDVLVAPNLYGDIISDLAAQMVGGLGFGCSGNIGLKLGVFEPSHGSAPKYAGQNKVNPIATILAAKMMLDFLGETEKGVRLEAAVAKVIAEGKVRTYDMGGSATTLELGEAVARPDVRLPSSARRPAPRDGALGERAHRPARGGAPRRAPGREDGRPDGDEARVDRGALRLRPRRRPGRLLRPPGEGAADGRHRRALPAAHGAGSRSGRGTPSTPASS